MIILGFRKKVQENKMSMSAFRNVVYSDVSKLNKSCFAGAFLPKAMLEIIKYCCDCWETIADNTSPLKETDTTLKSKLAYYNETV